MSDNGNGNNHPSTAVPLAIHPSRLSNFTSIAKDDFRVTSAPSASSSRHVDLPVGSGANSVPVRATVKKRRKPVVTLPLKPLSKTAILKKQKERRKKAEFYAGAFKSEAEKEKERLKKQRASLRKAAKPKKQRKTTSLQKDKGKGKKQSRQLVSHGGSESDLDELLAEMEQNAIGPPNSDHDGDDVTDIVNEPEPVSAYSNDEEEERIEYGPRPEKVQHETIADVGSSLNTPMTNEVDIQPEAGPSTPHVYHVQYPVGGTSYDNDGYGIFFNEEKEDPLDIWVDPALKDRVSMIRKIENEGGQISAEHIDDLTQLLIISPASTYIFDMYCHPDWLKPRDLERFKQKRHQAGSESNQDLWQRKVILKDWWIDDCLKAGRFLGQADGWSGCRAGGPPVDLHIITDKSNEDGPNDDLPEQDEAQATTMQPNLHNGGHEAQHGSADDVMPDEGDDMDIDPGGDEALEEDDVVAAIAPNETMSLDEVPDHDSAVESTATMPKVPTVKVAKSATPSADGIHEIDVEPEHILAEPSDTLNHVMSGYAVNLDATEAATWAWDQEANEAGPSNYAQNEVAGQDMEDFSEEEEFSDPANLFSGLKFWVDTSYPERISLIGKIKAAGAELATVYEDSTHVLIHNYKHSQWTSIVPSLTKQGIWFMNISWAIKSVDQGKKLPENDYIVIHGAPPSNERDEKPVIKVQPESIRPALYEQLLQPEEVSEIFEREAKMLEHGGTLKALSAFLVSKYGTYVERTWRNLYRDWERNQGRFHSISASPTKRRRISREETTHSPNPKAPAEKVIVEHGSLSSEKVAEILQSESETRNGKDYSAFALLLAKTYPQYDARNWKRMLTYWENKTGRFAPSQSHRDQPAVVLPTASSSSTTIAQSPQKGKYSNEVLDMIFSSPDVKQAGSTSTSNIGRFLASKYGDYHNATWAIMYSEWQRKTGRFKPSNSSATVPRVTRRGSSATGSTKRTTTSPSKSAYSEIIDEPGDKGPGSLTPEEMARIFKDREQDFIDRKLTFIEIGLMLKTELGVYARSTWRLQWTHWLQRKGKYENIISSLRSTVAAKAYAEQDLLSTGDKTPSETGSILDRNTVLSSHIPVKRKIKQNQYTIAEEKQMAKYISEYKSKHLVGQPTFRSRSVEAWISFAAQYPHRTAAAYSQHYREYCTRIDSYATGKEVTGADIEIDELDELEAPSGSQSRPVEIDDDAEAYDDPDNQPVIVIDDDEDDGDYVDAE
ncbi:uncharacterized protein IL334_006721 [Kwoniella shivajii]|uniref:BRCT domain-containing protein n=1 Tax=Kwoniella shivajii TaxID=564305 RepID=A0ABZ1D6Q8_9TREE|nr:hypothetical protein IL334_006721 [Kwoniella shivajii]